MHHFCQNLVLILLTAAFVACTSVTSNRTSSGDSGSGNGAADADSTDWTIPSEQVYVGAARDQIPSIDNPRFAPVSEIDFLEADELVVGLKIGNDVKVYPHIVLYYHEIVNDRVGGEPVAVTFCPLTGSGLAWNRKIDGQTTTFGVSGKIYKNNLITYDRRTGSYWNQMLARSVKGVEAGHELKTYQLIETTWRSLKQAYPNAKVLTGSARFDRSYETYPYSDYPTNNDYILFPITNEDDRLQRKTLLHGLFFQSPLDLRVLPIQNFPKQMKVYNRKVSQHEIVVAGSSSRELVVSYFRTLPDGKRLEFTGLSGEFPVIMKDQEGNRWNVFGEAVSGPREGERLKPVPSYNAYWFAWVDFFGNVPRRPPILNF